MALTISRSAASLGASAARRDLPDPKVAKKHADVARWVPAQGDCFVGGVSSDDPIQGALGNCYLVSALSALAQVRPDVIEKAVRKNADGTYTVTFHKDSFLGLFGRGGKPVEVTVDADMPTKNGTTPLYARGRDVKELWPLLIEKAYAKLDGGYQHVGVGGAPTTIWQALTGKSGGATFNRLESGDALWRKINNALNEKRPVAATTALGNAGSTGLEKSHVYAVLGTETKDGIRMVKLRNPWGDTEVGNDGKKDGIFLLPLSEFHQRFGMTFFGG